MFALPIDKRLICCVDSFGRAIIIKHSLFFLCLSEPENETEGKQTHILAGPEEPVSSFTSVV